jgi:uncharacterized membrane protein YhaH (DUF805 family)
LVKNARFRIEGGRDMLAASIGPDGINHCRSKNCGLPEQRTMNWPHLLLSIRGRINLAKWWIASGILIIIGFVVSTVIDRLDVEAVAAGLNRLAATSLAVVLALANLLVVYCLLVVTVKRLHDRNRRGWWILMFPLAPVVLASILSTFGEDLEPTLYYAVLAVALIITIAAVIELGVRPGTAGLNRYGPDPLAKIRADPRQGSSRESSI